MVLYAAADAPLMTIEPRDPPAALSVRPVAPDEEAVRAHFSKPHAYFVGAHTGCSCGFSYGDGDPHDRQGRESVRLLGAWLADAVARAGPIELYACWNGDEDKPPEVRATIGADELHGEREDFTLAERWLAVVVPRGDL